MSQQFNWRFYLEYNSDLTQKGLKTQKQAQWHYARYGRREGRICNINEVDWKYYLNRYPDIPKAGLNTMPKAKMHYAKWGKNEGRIPNRLYEQYNRPQQQQQQQLPMRWNVSKQSSTQNVVIHKNTTKKPNIKFNILIRCTYRPTYFKKCIESVLFQTHQQFNVIMCYDDERCMEYLQKYKNHSKIHIFKAPEVNKDQPYFYNLYCNFLLEKVKDGWILFLDDDDMFAHKNSLHVIANNIETNDDCVFWQVKLGKIIVFPPNIHDIRFRQISCIGFCFHSLYKNKGEWAAQGGSDYKYISEVLKAHTRFKRKQIHSVLTGTQHSMNGQFGLYDKIKLEAVLKKFDIKQGHVSESLIHLKHRFLNKYSLTSINKNNAPALFFGVYNKFDIETILNHGGDTLVIFGGSEVSNIQAIKAKNNIRILSISLDMQTRLSKYNICSCYVLLNMVDSFIFKPVPTEELGKKIFIYNGYTKKKDNASIYNEPLINEVVKRCPDKEFIFSNELGVPYEKMPEIYKQCYIGLRLTGHDGNANMVQEMEAMKIPVVHNHSEYGLKWKNVEDVVGYINGRAEVPDLLTCSGKKILLNTNSNLDVTAGDTVMISNLVNSLTSRNNNVTIITPYMYKSVEINVTSKKKCRFVTSHKTLTDIVNAIDRLSNEVDIVFVRNHNILAMLQGKDYLYKTVLYGLDVHAVGLGLLKNEFSKVITQSKKLKDTLISSGVESQKISIVEPFSYKYKFDIPERTDNEIRLIYCGTLRDEENILEIIEEFKKIHKERPEVVLKIVYGKIHGNGTFTKKVNEYIKNGVKGITFKHNLSHKDACYEIATSDIGICWRKNGWGDNGEVSTKVKEYKMYGVEICYGKIAILCPINKISHYQNLINSIKRQKYIFFEAKILLNKILKKDLPFLDVPYYINFYQYESNKSLGFILNHAIYNLIDKNTDCICKFDCDDVYTEDYLTEQISQLYKENCFIVGKATQYWWINNTDTILINNINNENKYVQSLRGNSLFFKKCMLEKYNIKFSNITKGEDTDFIKQCISKEIKLFSTSVDNLFTIKYENSTWNATYSEIYYNYSKCSDITIYYKLFKCIYSYNYADKNINNLYKADFPKIILPEKNITVNKFETIFHNDNLQNLINKEWNASVPNGIEFNSSNKVYDFGLSNKIIVNPLEILVKPEYNVIKYSNESNYEFTIICGFYINTDKQFKLMKKTIKSLFDQKYKNFELILVDDYISPAFQKQVYEIINNSNNVTYIKNKNNYGVYISKNIAINESKGNILCFCDSDDTYDECRLSYYYDIYRNNDIYFTYELYIDYNKKHKFCPISLTFRKECLSDIGYFNDNRISCDSAYMNKLFNYYTKHEQYIPDQIVIDKLEDNQYIKHSNKFKLVEKSLYNVGHENIGERLSHTQDYKSRLRLYIYYNYVNLIKGHKNFKYYNMYYKPNYLYKNNYIENKATLICSTNKPILLDFIINKFNSFEWENKELIICLHNIKVDSKNLKLGKDKYLHCSYDKYQYTAKNIKLIEFNENNTIGNMLNFGCQISNGEYIFKIDDDDYYSPLYIKNSIDLHKKTHNKCIVGKSSFPIYFKDKDELRNYGWKLNEGYTNWIGGFSLSFHRNVLNYTNFKFLSKSEDSSFIQSAEKYGFKLYTSELNNDSIFIRIKKYNSVHDESLYTSSKSINKENDVVLRKLIKNIEFLN